MKLFKRTSLLFCITITSFSTLFAQSKDFKAAQSLDIYHSMLRELSVFYVDSVKIDKLVTTGIEAMLESLDPYTVYMPEDVAEDFDFITTGQYGGVGALIKKVPAGIEISEPYQGFPADKAGLVAGDIILEIDGKKTKEMDVSVASKNLKGVIGDPISLKVLKLRGGDTISLTLTRERIHISDVSYSGMLAGGVGYIRLSSFTRGGSRDFKNAFQALKKTGNLQKLIIDVRYNGGGLLDEAVNMVNLFVPRGTEIVAARGRIKEFEAVYKTKDEPLDTKIPIAVLVNSSSASAAEILAGSLQDLDRAVIIGTRTFGKGLVQSVRDLGYNAKLKITTAKYYIPSGRCVQAIDYSHRNEDGSVGHIPDSLVKAFTTKNGRTVYDGGGINPDIKIEPTTYAKISYDIVGRDILRDYSIQYYAKHQTIAEPEQFSLTDEEYNDFVNFAAAKEFDDRTTTEVLLEKLTAAIKAEHIYDETKEELNALQKEVTFDKHAKLIRFRPELQQLLEEEICNRYYYEQGRFRSMLRNDKQADEAIRLLGNSEEYQKILRP